MYRLMLFKHHIIQHLIYLYIFFDVTENSKFFTVTLIQSIKKLFNFYSIHCSFKNLQRNIISISIQKMFSSKVLKKC